VSLLVLTLTPNLFPKRTPFPALNPSLLRHFLCSLWSSECVARKWWFLWIPGVTREYESSNFFLQDFSPLHLGIGVLWEPSLESMRNTPFGGLHGTLIFFWRGLPHRTPNSLSPLFESGVPPPPFLWGLLPFDSRGLPRGPRLRYPPIGLLCKPFFSPKRSVVNAGLELDFPRWVKIKALDKFRWVGIPFPWLVVYDTVKLPRRVFLTRSLTTTFFLVFEKSFPDRSLR